MTSPPSDRPPLTSDLTGAEFLRWYWLKDELTDFARRLEVRTTGGKELLAQRISARLDGRAFTEPLVAKRPNARQLSGSLTLETLIPEGQRCSQVLRGWFVQEAGASFHFDAEMRNFFMATNGTQTLADALNHWYRTRGQEQRTIDSQFEYNRFTRSWHDKYPAGSKDELLAAWRQYRNEPIDSRGKA